MRACLLVSSFLAFMVSGSVAAQSIEESYAKLCSDPAKAKSETCQILGKSLMAKLHGQQAPAASGSSATGPDQATEAEWRKRWGVLYDMIGKEMFSVPGFVAGMTPGKKLAGRQLRSNVR